MRSEVPRTAKVHAIGEGEQWQTSLSARNTVIPALPVGTSTEYHIVDSARPNLLGEKLRILSHYPCDIIAI